MFWEAKLARRDVLRMSLLAAASGAIAACAPKEEEAAETEPAAEESKEEAPEPTQAKEEPTPAPAKAVEISFMGWGGEEEDEGVKSAIEKFESEQSQVTVTWMHTPERYTEKLLALVAAGTPPDTAFIGSDVFTTYARDGMLLDITEKVSSDSLVGQEDYFIQPQEEQRCTYEGRWYGIGSCWVAPHIYYNADIFEEMGVEPPSSDPAEAWDWDTLLERARALTVDKNGKHPNESGFDPENIDRWGIHLDSSSWIPIHAFIESNGGNYVNRDTGLVGLGETESLEAIQAIADLVNVHHVMPRSTMAEQLGMSNTRMLDGGKLAMAIDGSWALSWMYKIESTLGTAVLPMFDEPATNMQAHIHCALEGSEHPDAAWEWIRYLSTPYYQTMFCEMGLWLPSQTELMTPEGLDTWLNDEVHPKGYEQIVTDYVPNYGKVLYTPPGWPKVGDILNPAFDAIWVGDAQATDVLPQASEEANEILKQEALK